MELNIVIYNSMTVILQPAVELTLKNYSQLKRKLFKDALPINDLRHTEKLLLLNYNIIYIIHI